MEDFIVYGQATQGGVSWQFVLKWKLMYIFMAPVMFWALVEIKQFFY